ncbi:MAG: nicotinic acid mononucleotide adenyltransferase [Flavobacteriaceae bacterium]|jgi:antitoxin component YwqK of YwqJK toxin-antitoxin module|nr:nicotinic acid mononucleotide adenyltransferase [Flavobacteriaceae bacterium]MCB0485028.1 nicotinic acid mononucleotide adenyltransferase [Flavobacteriaceae bacterium]
MRKIVLVLMMLFVGLVYSQEDKKVTYEQKGDLVQATYYYDNGQVEQQGFFKQEKLHGEWKYYNEEGKEIAVGSYNLGKKVGKWTFKNDDSTKEVEYLDGKVINVSEVANSGS